MHLQGLNELYSREREVQVTEAMKLNPKSMKARQEAIHNNDAFFSRIHSHFQTNVDSAVRTRQPVNLRRRSM